MTVQSIFSNFTLILFILMVMTGTVWFIEVCICSKSRRKKAAIALAEFDARINNKSSDQGTDQIKPSDRVIIENRFSKTPILMEYFGCFFPIIALVFFFRSFLYEPFKIPSSSMAPTLLAGDLILVNKFIYGIRLPMLHTKIINVLNPKRNDVVVFRYPKNVSENYIKRIIGIPGDIIVYKNKHLIINGQVVSYAILPDYFLDENSRYYKQLNEKLNHVSHALLIDEYAPNFVAYPENFLYSEFCVYDVDGFSCKVPRDHYFVMGDNRDNSLDSRYWGFVPNKNIVGKAFFVWMNFNNFKRIGHVY